MSFVTEAWTYWKVLLLYYNDPVRPSSFFYLATGLTALCLLRLLLIIWVLQIFGVFVSTYGVLHLKMENI